MILKVEQVLIFLEEQVNILSLNGILIILLELIMIKKMMSPEYSKF